LPLKKGSPKKTVRRKKKAPPSSLERAVLCAHAAIEKKAEEPLILDMTKISDMAEFFVICHGIGTRHVQAIAENIIERLHKAKIKMIGEEGLMEAQWVLLDCGDVVVHIFDEPSRNFYNLERLWIHSEEVEIPKE
jgi:ribosome-associated protein